MGDMAKFILTITFKMNFSIKNPLFHLSTIALFRI